MKTITHSLPRFTLASLCGLLMAAPSFVNGANIVQNSSFEDNNSGVFPQTAPLTFWTVGEVLGVPATPNQNIVDGQNTAVSYALAPHTGVIAAAFRSTTNTVTTGGLATLSQTLSTTVAQAYELSFWLANPIQQAGGNINNVFSVSWNGVLLALSNPSLTETSVGSNNYIVAPDTAWFQVTASNLVGTGSDTLKFSARNSDFATLLDDVSVQASGVPDSGSTFAMFGIALAGLALVSRKTKQLEIV